MTASRRVLAIEDDEDLRDAIAAFLALHRCEVATAVDGIDAVRWLEQHRPPDLIVLDLMMPNMDGLEFRAYQLARPDLAAIPVVVVTARDDVDRSAAVFRGVQWLAKPFRADELRAAIRAAFET